MKEEMGKMERCSNWREEESQYTRRKERHINTKVVH